MDNLTFDSYFNNRNQTQQVSTQQVLTQQVLTQQVLTKEDILQMITFRIRMNKYLESNNQNKKPGMRLSCRIVNSDNV
jgi:hypothetical protein